MRRYRLANTPPEKRKYLRKSQLWSEEFTAKLFCNVEFWLERLPKLIEVGENLAKTLCMEAGGQFGCSIVALKVSRF
jgi:hypothetical protein